MRRISLHGCRIVFMMQDHFSQPTLKDNRSTSALSALIVRVEISVYLVKKRVPSTSEMISYLFTVQFSVFRFLTLPGN